MSLVKVFAVSIFCCATSFGALEDLADTKPPKDAPISTSGIVSVILNKGTGTIRPKLKDRVKVHYAGWAADGRLFDSSENSGAPPILAVDGVIKGWTEVLQTMVEGEKRRIWIPANLAFGTKGRPGRPGGNLIYDIELISIEMNPGIPEPPKDLIKAPADAVLEKSGAAWKTVGAGQGTPVPVEAQRIRIHYTIWLANGDLFHTTRVKAEAAILDVASLSPVLKDAFKEMRQGEKRLIWLPAGKVAAGAFQPKLPQGQSVMEVVLDGFDRPAAKE